MKKIIPIVLTLVLALTACGGSKKPADSAVQTENVVPTAIVVPESIEMTVGDEAKNLEAKVEPAGVDTELQYKSSDEKVATVDEDGNVTAVAAGECVITTTIKADDGDNVATETADSTASSKEDKQPAEDAAESGVSEEPELKGETTVTVKDAEPVEEEVADSTESKDEDTAKPDSNKKPDSKPDNGGHDAAKPAVKPDNGGNATKPENKPEPAKPAPQPEVKPEPEKPAPQPEVKPEPEKPAPQPEVNPEPPKPAPDPVTPPKEETTTPPSEENWVPGQDNGIIPGGGSTGDDASLGGDNGAPEPEW